jgi:hypothetical protein
MKRNAAKSIVITAVLPIVIIYTSLSYSTPTWMYISRYAADSTTCGNLKYPDFQEACIAFWNAAVACHPNGPAPYSVQYYTGTDVTLTKMTNYSRAISDFVFFCGHGMPNEIIFENDSKTSCATLNNFNMNFGGIANGGTRWAYLSSCQTLRKTDPNQSYFAWLNFWDGTFNGVQCVLGFAANHISYDDAFYTFWYYWTGLYRQDKDDGHGIRSILDAHFDSIYWDNVLRMGWSESPAILTSYLPSDGHFFCDDNYTQATSVQGFSGAVYYFYENLVKP